MRFVVLVHADHPPLLVPLLLRLHSLFLQVLLVLPLENHLFKKKILFLQPVLVEPDRELSVILLGCLDGLSLQVHLILHIYCFLRCLQPQFSIFDFVYILFQVLEDEVSLVFLVLSDLGDGALTLPDELHIHLLLLLPHHQVLDGPRGHLRAVLLIVAQFLHSRLNQGLAQVQRLGDLPLDVPLRQLLVLWEQVHLPVHGLGNDHVDPALLPDLLVDLLQTGVEILFAIDGFVVNEELETVDLLNGELLELIRREELLQELVCYIVSYQ